MLRAREEDSPWSTAQYIGIDLHRRYFQVCAVAPDGTRRWEARFGATAEDVAAFVTRAVGASVVAVEASGPTWRFVDELTPHVARVVVVDTAKTRLKAGYAAKTDRLDARRLADALRRDSVVGIYVPSVAIRELRELTRAHRTLVRVSTGLKQRLHALVLRHRLEAPAVSDLFAPPGLAWLQTAALPPRAGQARDGLRTLWMEVAAREQPLRAEIGRVAVADPAVRAIDPIPGIGPVLGLLDSRGSRRRAPIPDGRGVGQLRGPGPARGQQRRTDAVWPNHEDRLALSAVGVD